MNEPRGDVVGWLIAHEEIRQLASRYAIALDSRDLDTLVNLFVDDVQVGRKALATMRCERASPSNWENLA